MPTSRNPIVLQGLLHALRKPTIIGVEICFNTKYLVLKRGGVKLVNWGDGTVNDVSSHTYKCGGYYELHVIFENREQIALFPPSTVRVIEWGNITLGRGSFMGCSLLKIVDENQPPLDNDLSFLFAYCYSFSQVLNWETSRVTNMGAMFHRAKSFNQPVKFDTSNVTNMDYMFSDADAFNQPVKFDTSNVTDMCDMFYGAVVFNQPVNFDTSNVTNMERMFYGAESFNQPVKFDTSNVTNMERMFYGADAFNEAENGIRRQ